ncbi:hypothetical protein J6A31_08945 [bacterium]|nr:hypothetical protein [bacterium]
MMLVRYTRGDVELISEISVCRASNKSIILCPTDPILHAIEITNLTKKSMNQILDKIFNEHIINLCDKNAPKYEFVERHIVEYLLLNS